MSLVFFYFKGQVSTVIVLQAKSLTCQKNSVSLIVEVIVKSKSYKQDIIPSNAQAKTYKSAVYSEPLEGSSPWFPRTPPALAVGPCTRLQKL